MADVFQKDLDGNLKITPDVVQPADVVISRAKAEQDLLDAKNRKTVLEAELVLAQENVDQKQAVVDKCVELGVA